MFASNTSNTSSLIGQNKTGDSLLSENGANDSPILFPEELRMFLYILLVSLAVFGVVVNIINMMTFWKLRTEETINLNLFGLALSDWLVCLSSLVFTLTSGTWYLKDIFTILKIVPLEVMYLSVGVFHSVCVRITVLLTTSIAFQRCPSVVLPLKVKGLFTRPRVVASLVVSFILPALMIFIPTYYVNRFVWVDMDSLNMTVLRVVVTDDFYDVNVWTTPINNTILLFLPFITVFLCTIIMIKRLRQMATWRLQNVDGGVVPQRRSSSKEPSAQTQQAPSLSASKKKVLIQKERRIFKLVLTISLVFLVCYAPNIFIAMSVAFSRSFNITSSGETHELIGYVGFLLDTFNSSINIFIYITNSTIYRNKFKALFCCKER